MSMRTQFELISQLEELPAETLGAMYGVRMAIKNKLSTRCADLDKELAAIAQVWDRKRKTPVNKHADG